MQDTQSTISNLHYDRIEDFFAANIAILKNIVEPESGVRMLNNIVDNIEECGQQNIDQSCFHPHYNKVSFVSALYYDFQTIRKASLHKK